MRQVTIMMGISGSGKSTYISKMVPIPLRVCSADHYFLKEGEYNFNPSKLGEAHGECFRNYVESLRKEIPGVVVDNTNTTLAEISPYILGAQAYQYEVKVVALMCDAQVAAKRNTHGTPEATLSQQALRIADTLSNWPRFWPPIERVG